MTTIKNWDELATSHELAYFKGSLATEFPESYTIEEMKTISDGMDASTAEVEAAIRADFAAMPETAQAMMLDLLSAADPANREWWLELLTGFRAPDAPPVPTSCSVS